MLVDHVYIKEIQEFLVEFAKNPEDIAVNLKLAELYKKEGHLASSATFYIRVADRTDVPIIRYNALLELALIFIKQGSRYHSAQALLHYAIAVLPYESAAHYYLSKLYESTEFTGHWHMAYSHACHASENSKNFKNESYLTPPEYSIKFQKALSSWWIGLLDESFNILRDLYLFNYNLDDLHFKAVKSALLHKSNNGVSYYGYDDKLPNHNFNKKEFYSFFNDTFKYSNIKIPKNIDQNYSQSFQDIFVLTMLMFKKEGSYVEVGSSHPIWNNNTYMFESSFNWFGLSVDINKSDVDLFKKIRSGYNKKSEVRRLDATTDELKKSIEEFKLKNDLDSIDYLQVDIEPAYNSLKALKTALECSKYAVITFEHDFYIEGNKIKEEAYNLLSSLGYVRIGDNISFNQKEAYEDWYIHPDYVDIFTNLFIKNFVDKINSSKLEKSNTTPAALIFKKTNINV